MTAAAKFSANAVSPGGERERAASSREAGHEVTSAELFGNGREIRIRHADDVYILRQTSRGKLILTK
jgi:hemin uptake protein HemP